MAGWCKGLMLCGLQYSTQSSRRNAKAAKETCSGPSAYEWDEGRLDILRMRVGRRTYGYLPIRCGRDRCRHRRLDGRRRPFTGLSGGADRGRRGGWLSHNRPLRGDVDPDLWAALFAASDRIVALVPCVTAGRVHRDTAGVATVRGGGGAREP